MLCISEASGINSVQTSLAEGCDSRNHMETKKSAKLKGAACHINGNRIKSMPSDNHKYLHLNK